MSNKAVVKAFIEAWSRLDPDELASYFTEDGVYHNMPIEPVQGREALKTFIGGFIGNWTATHWEILTLVEAGDTVIAERVDRTEAGGVQVDLPCCGVFEMRDGKIAAWRDYFDMATYTRAFERRK